MSLTKASEMSGTLLICQTKVKVVELPVDRARKSNHAFMIVKFKRKSSNGSIRTTVDLSCNYRVRIAKGMQQKGSRTIVVPTIIIKRPKK